jgi:hypothetical protein
MTGENTDPFEYDVALSFAGEDRALAEELGNLLIQKNITVFYDEYQAANAELWEKDMVDHLVNIYARKARYCLLLISQYFPLQQWTTAERTSAQERALRDVDEYILPIQLDDTKVPGVTETTGYRDLRQHSMENIVDLLEQKLAEARDPSGPPSKSHDLRSGHIPSAHPKSNDQ